MTYTLYIDAVRGNDTADGTQNAPFKTPSRALDAARAILAKGDAADITLQFADGVYSVLSPLVLRGEEIAAKEYSLTLRGSENACIRGTYDIPARLFKKVEGKEYYSYTLPKEAYIDGKPPKSKAE